MPCCSTLLPDLSLLGRCSPCPLPCSRPQNRDQVRLHVDRTAAPQKAPSQCRLSVPGCIVLGLRTTALSRAPAAGQTFALKLVIRRVRGVASTLPRPVRPARYLWIRQWTVLPLARLRSGSSPPSTQVHICCLS